MSYKDTILSYYVGTFLISKSQFHSSNALLPTRDCGFLSTTARSLMLHLFPLLRHSNDLGNLGQWDFTGKLATRYFVVIELKLSHVISRTYRYNCESFVILTA